MKNVKQMITEKDLLYLEDIFNWHLNAINKDQLYLTNLEDKEAYNLVKNILDMHETFCDDIVGFLEDN